MVRGSNNTKDSKNDRTKIMVVEDEIIVAEDIKQSLEALGYTVTAVTQYGEEAVNRAQKDKPDLILMDIVLLGKMTGIEAAAEIRKRTDIPIIYLTAYADDKTLEEAKITEPFGYIIKPFEERELHSTIEMAIYKSKTEKRLKDLNSLLLAIRNVNQFIASETDLNDLLQKTCESLLETRNLMDVSIAILDENTNIIRPTAHAGNHKRKSWSISLDGVGKVPKCIKSIMKTRATIVIESTNKYCNGCNFCTYNKDHRSIIAPMIHQKELVGISSVCLDKNIEIKNEEIELLNEVSGDLALAYTKFMTQDKLKKSEEKFRSMVQNSSDIIMILDPDANVQFISESVTRILGHKPEDLIGNCSFDYCHPDDLDHIVNAFEKVVKTPKTHITIELRVKNTKGDWYTVVATANNFLDTPEIGGVIVNFHNITERKLAEEALIKSEEKFRMISETIQDVFWISSPGVTDQLYVSPAYENVWGRSVQECMAKPKIFIDSIHDDDRKDYIKIFEKYHAKGKPYECEYRIVRPDGSFRWISERGYPIRDEAGKTISMTGVCIDITEKRNAETELRLSEEKYRSFVQNLNGIAFRGDGDFKPIFFHGGIKAITGYTEKEFLDGKVKWLDLIHEDDVQTVLSDVNKTGSGTKDFHEREYRLVRKDGKTIWVQEKLQILRDDAGKMTGAQGIVYDITNRKAAEIALKESEEKYRSLVDNMADIVFESDIEGHFTYVSPQVEQIMGYKPEEVIGRSGYEFIHEDDIEAQLDDFTKAIENESYSYEYRVKHKDGHYIPVQGSGKLVGTGDERRIIGLVRDFTEKKAAEENLKYQANLMANVSDAVISTDEKFRIKSWNKAAEQIYGFKAEEVLGRTVGDVTNIEYTDISRQEVLQIFIDDGIWKGEVIQKNKAGDPLNILASVSVIKDLSGNTTGAVAINHDITHRKRAEESIRESEERFRTLFENSPIPLREINLENLKRYLIELLKKNKDINNLKKYLRLHPEILNKCMNLIEIMDMNKANLELYNASSKKVFKDNYLNTFTKDSNKNFIEELLAIANGERKFEHEIVIKTLDGEKKHVLLKWHAAPGHEEALDRVLVNIIDLTEQKRKEEEMKRGMMKYKLEDGNIYLVQEQTTGLSVEAFNDILKVGYPGVAISRMVANQYKRLLDQKFNFLWLSEKGGKSSETLEPKIKYILQYLESHEEKHAIILDRMDYLITKNGFKTVLNFVHQLKELAYFNNHIIILSIDPGTITENQLRQLEKECSEVQTKESIRLPEDQLQILNYVQKQNFLGIKPSFSNIEQELDMSKPTVRKRVGKLQAAGYVQVNTHGRTKVVELTEKSRRLF